MSLCRKILDIVDKLCKFCKPALEPELSLSITWLCDSLNDTAIANDKTVLTPILKNKAVKVLHISDICFTHCFTLSFYKGWQASKILENNAFKK